MGIETKAPLGQAIHAQPSSTKYEKLVDVDLGSFNQIPVKPVSKPNILCLDRTAMEWVGFTIGAASSMAIGAAGGVAMLAVESVLCSTLAPIPTIAIGVTGGIPGMIVSGGTSHWFSYPRKATANGV